VRAVSSVTDYFVIASARASRICRHRGKITDGLREKYDLRPFARWLAARRVGGAGLFDVIVHSCALTRAHAMIWKSLGDAKPVKSPKPKKKRAPGRIKKHQSTAR